LPNLISPTKESHFTYSKENILLIPNQSLLNLPSLIKWYHHPFSQVEALALSLDSLFLTIPTPCVKSNSKLSKYALQSFDSMPFLYPLQLYYLHHHHILLLALHSSFLKDFPEFAFTLHQSTHYLEQVEYS